MNEVQVGYSIDSTGVTLTRTVTVELFYLYGADTPVSGYASSGETLVVKNLPTIPGVSLPTSVTVTVTPGTTFGSRASAYHTFVSNPPQSGTLSTPVPPTGTVTVPPAPLTSPVVVDYLRSGNRLNCALVPLPTVTTGVPGAAGVWQGAEVNDPCVNVIPGEWTPYASPTAGTLGRQNSVYSPPNPGQVDTKAHIRGLTMLSAGELGYIHLPGSSTHPTTRGDT